MNMDYTIYYNGKSALELGLVVEHRPQIPSAVANITEFEVPSRDGILHRSEGTVQNVELVVPFAFVVSDPDEWMGVYRNIMSWLYSKGDGKLILSEDPDWFYQVVSVSVAEAPERVGWRGGRFSATFTIKGYAYETAGEQAQTNFYNRYDDIAHPLYKLTGEGNATITVNGNSMTANVGQEMVIDTDLMIAYRVSNGTMVNTSVSGDYEGLWLNKGNNTVSFNRAAGMTLTVYPRWRKRL